MGRSSTPAKQLEGILAVLNAKRDRLLAEAQAIDRQIEKIGVAIDALAEDEA